MQQRCSALFLLVLISSVTSLINNRLRIRSHHSIQLNLQLSDFPSAPLEDSLSIIQSSSENGFDLVQIANAITIITGGLLFYAYESRPRGASQDNLIEVKKSENIANQLGVYAKTFIPANTVIGTYPGYVKEATKVFDSKNDQKAIDASKKYIWMLTSDLVIDPTNNDGVVPLEYNYFGLIKIPTTMSRINEPPLGKDCNAYSRDESGYEVQIVAERNIFPGDEIFIDYGRGYDRSEYSIDDEEDKKAVKKEQQMKKDKEMEEEEYMKINPIVGGSTIDQDTSISDGFLSKLSKKDTYSKESGIMSPEEASRMFSEQGDTMFASDEDRALIESITGKSKVATGAQRATQKKVPPPSRATNENTASDDDLLKTFMSQIGRNEPGSDENIDIDDIFGSNAGLKMPTGPPPGWKPSSVSSGTPSSISGAGGGMESTQIKQPVMSPAEAEDLQRRMDAMTDEQIEKVFAKLRNTMQGQMQDDLQKKLTEGSGEDMLNAMESAAGQVTSR
jgi:hypothetical protein